MVSLPKTEFDEQETQLTTQQRLGHRVRPSRGAQAERRGAAGLVK
jgi:hypothetical protein